MTLSPALFTFVIFLALSIVTLAPLILLVLWVIDIRRGALW